MKKMTGKFDWQTSEVVPAFVKGDDAKTLYDSTEDVRTGTMGYDPESKLYYGSTPFVAARIDTLVKPLGLRVATLSDLSRPEVMRMIKDNHYSDTPTLIVRSAEDSRKENIPILERLMQEAEKRNVSLPFMVSGFDVLRDESGRGYGIMISPREDFTIISDERLGKKYAGKTFNNVDEIGLPKFDNSGNRTWYAGNEGLSRLYLNRSLSLGSDSDSLADSSDCGRVVLVSGEATAQNFAQDYQQRLQREADSVKSELDKWLKDSMARMPGRKS